MAKRVWNLLTHVVSRIRGQQPEDIQPPSQQSSLPNSEDSELSKDSSEHGQCVSYERHPSNQSEDGSSEHHVTVELITNIKQLLFPEGKPEGYPFQNGVKLFCDVMSAWSDFEKQHYAAPKKNKQKDLVIKLLSEKMDERLHADFPFYLGIVYRLRSGSTQPHHYEEFWKTCVDKLEGCDGKLVAEAFLLFLDSSKDVDVLLPDDTRTTAFTILESICMDSLNLRWNSKPGRLGDPLQHFIYGIMLWTTFVHKIHSVTHHDAQLDLWNAYLLQEKNCLSCPDEMKNGMEFGVHVHMDASYSFTQDHLATLLAPEKYAHKYKVLRNALEKLHGCIKVPLSFLRLLSEVRHKHMNLFQQNMLNYIMQVGETRPEAMQEGLEFLDTVYNIWRNKKKWDMNKAFDAEIEGWLSHFIRFVNFGDSGDKVADSLSWITNPASASTVIEKYSGHIKEQISQQLKQMKGTSIHQLYHLYHGLGPMMPSSFLEEHLKEQKHYGAGSCVCDGTFEMVLELLYEHTPWSAAERFKRVKTVIVRLESVYCKRKGAKRFLNDVLRSKIYHSASIQYEANTPDSAQLEEFLQTHIRHQHPNSGEIFLSVLKTLASNAGLTGSHLHSCTLMALLKELISSSEQMKPALHQNCELESQMNMVIEHVTRDIMGSLECKNLHEECCWRFIARCCKMIPVLKLGFEYDWLLDNQYAIRKLGQIYSTYCKTKRLTDQQCVMLQVPRHVTSPPVQQYFQWIADLHNALHMCTEWLSYNPFPQLTFDEIDLFLDQYTQMNSVASSVNGATLVPDRIVVVKVRSDYLHKYRELEDVVYPTTTSALDGSTERITVLSLLQTYNVELPEGLVQKLTSDILLPGGDKTKLIGTLQEKLPPQASPESTSDTEVHQLQLTVNVHLRLLYKLLQEVNRFLEPFQPYMSLCLKLRNNRLFMSYINTVRKEQSSNGSDSSMSTLQCLSLNEDSNSSILHLARAVRITQEFFKRQINNSQVTYQEVTANGTLDIQDLKCDIVAELKAIADVISVKGEASLYGIECMVSLFLHKPYIENLHDVCKMFGLKRCLDDSHMEELLQIAQDLDCDSARAQLTSASAVKKHDKIKRYMMLEEAKDHLTLFKMLQVYGTSHFYELIRDHFFADSQELQAWEALKERAQTSFESTYETITQQLQHEDYEEQVLTHLRPAFDYIVPFMNRSHTLDLLMKEVLELDASSRFSELRTVCENIHHIQQWFSQVQGDVTMENVSAMLECILQFGSYHFHKVELTLKIDVDPLSATTNIAKEWESERIANFEQKLALLDSGGEREKQRSEFFQWNEVAHRLLGVNIKLRELGCGEFREFMEPLRCCTSLKDAEQKVSRAERTLAKWCVTVRQLQEKHMGLLFLSPSKVLRLYSLIHSFQTDFAETEIVKAAQEIAYLFENTSETRKKLTEQAEEAAFYVERLTCKPMEMVGMFFDRVLSKGNLRLSLSPAQNKPQGFQGILHNASGYQQDQLIRLIFQIVKNPQPFDLLYCSASTTEEDVNLFMRRVEGYHSRHYIILKVNNLPYELQEVVLKLYFDLRERSPTCAIHFIETAPSIIREVPWIETMNQEERSPSLRWSDETKFAEQAPKPFIIQLVYGCPGAGKTHYIRTRLNNYHSAYVNIAINEAFTSLSAIRKLNGLLQVYKPGSACAVFFNFTTHPPSDAVDKESYAELMENIGWFFFELLVFCYVEDHDTGESFSLPTDASWTFYVEVPATQDPTEGLKWFKESIPVLGLSGEECRIDPQSQYCIDDGVRLVWKYLKAYRDHRIDTLFCESVRGKLQLDFTNKSGGEVQTLLRQNHITGDRARKIFEAYRAGNLPFLVLQENLVKFGSDPDPSDEECWQLLLEFMPDLVKKSKIKQRLFLKYMERRCYFLEKTPGFNSNEGIGGSDDTNTVMLGSTLMETMLKEVTEMCQQQWYNWSDHPHQQLIYNFRDGGGTFGLITLKLSDVAMREKFKMIGVDIPDETKLHSREVLDRYLSEALNLKLEMERISLIDRNNYVLTLDFALKMINIHERYECGMPVIIEGETGVGKTALVEMLGKLWNQSLMENWNKWRNEIVDMFTKNVDEHVKSSHEDHSASIKSIEKLRQCKHAVISDIWQLLRLDDLAYHQPSAKFYSRMRRVLLERKEDPILCLVQLDSSVQLDILFQNIEAEEANLKHISSLLCVLLNSDLQSLLHKISIDAAMKPHDIEVFLKPVFEQANRLSKFGVKSLPGAERKPFVIAYLDEVNTSSCLGLLKEIIIDRSFDGKEIPENVFIIGACNPHRANSLATHIPKDLSNRGMQEHSSKHTGILKYSYYVRELHPTIHLLKWDYGALDGRQELEYVNAKLKMLQTDIKAMGNVPEMSDPEKSALAKLIVNSQAQMRAYGKEQLLNAGVHEEEARLHSCSCVSQRDIQRVCVFYKWLMKKYTLLANISDMENPHQHAVLVALGIVYYFRLPADYRKKYQGWIDKETKGSTPNFTEALNSELDWYVSRAKLPAGIAKTQALRENLFTIIICCVTRTPLIIEGEPGTSKTLSFNIAVGNLKGKQSKSKHFKNSDLFPFLDPHFYQCSRRTTSNDIRTVFKRAVNRQEEQAKGNTLAYCVVFMDEAGLPEREHESLKVLHFYLDNPNVSFVAITNHPLDAAKTNRAVSVYRPEASAESDELEEIARSCLCLNDEHTTDTVKALCQGYRAVMKTEQWRNVFGLRDFIYFLIYLRRKHPNDLAPDGILRALERNFHGITSESFGDLCQFFYKSQNSLEERNVLSILKEGLEDQTLSLRGDLQTSIQCEARYKMIIDPSEDDSLVRLLFAFGVLDEQRTRMYVCSDLARGSQTEISTIARIRHSAFEGHTVLLCQTSRIHESFYDLFNQRFRYIHFHGEDQYYANIAVGAYSKLSRVNHRFQCIVVVKESELQITPSPFLDRFEKYHLSHRNLLNVALGNLPPNIKKIVETVQSKAKEFLQAVQKSKSLYGFTKDDTTLDSLLLTILPAKRWICHEFIEEDQLSHSHQERQSDRKVALLKSLLDALRRKAGFTFVQDLDELETDASRIFEKVEADEEFRKLLADLELQRIELAVNEAIQTLCIQSEFSETDVQTSSYSCMIISVLQQWLIRHICKRLMQLMTPEGFAVHCLKIPKTYWKNYLKHQVHFSLKALIVKHSKLLCDDRESAYAPTKLLCFTRSSPTIKELPMQFPSPVYAQEQAGTNARKVLKELVSDNPDQLLVCKLTSSLTQAHLEKLLKQFIQSENRKVLLLVVNMQKASHGTNTKMVVNHIRIMIEQAENESGLQQKLFVVLLHFPQTMFFHPCYPSIFLRGWDHHYLDSVAENSATLQGNAEVQLNAKVWVEQFCLFTDTASTRPTLQVLSSLYKEATLTIASKVFSDESYQEMVVELLRQEDVQQTLCNRFCMYWKPEVMNEYLRKWAVYIYTQRSTLTLTDSLQKNYKELFYKFLVHMVSRMRETFTIELVTSPKNPVVKELFNKILHVIPIPQLYDLEYMTTARATPTASLVHTTHFPFFKEVFLMFENVIERSRQEMNWKINDLQMQQDMDEHVSQYASDKYSSILKKEEAECLQCVAHSIKHYEQSTKERDMWRWYLRDFLLHNLRLVPLTQESLSKDSEIEILMPYFDSMTKEDDILLRFFLLHVHVNANLLNLARASHTLQLVAALPRGDLTSVELVHTSQSQLSTLSNIIRPVELANFVICSLFDFLECVIQAEDVVKIKPWYRHYLGTVSIPAAKKYLYNSKLAVEDQYKFTVMQATFLILQCHLDQHGCMEVTKQLFTMLSVSEEYPLDRPSLTKMVYAGTLTILKNGSKNTTTLAVFMEGLLEHVFSKWYKPRMQDVQWFLHLINHSLEMPDLPQTWLLQENEQLQSVNTQLYKCLSNGVLKFYLSRILVTEESGNQSGPLALCNQEFRSTVGTILAESGPYIPKFYQVLECVLVTMSPEADTEQLNLAHMYFEVVLEFLGMRYLNLQRLLHIATQISDSQSTSKGELAVLSIEKQATLQLIVQALAKDPITAAEELASAETSQHMTKLLEESTMEYHAIVLAHNMMKNETTKGSRQKLLCQLKDPYLTGEIPSLKSLSKLLPDDETYDTHSFSFIGPKKIENELGQLYIKIHSILDMYEHQPDESVAKMVTFAQEWCSETEPIQCDGLDGKGAFQMILWLVVYYEFYSKQKEMAQLAASLVLKLQHLLDEECLQLVRCFLDPKAMVYKPEDPPDYDLTPDNAANFENTGPDSLKVDPIFQLFNHQTQEDISLCHATANMVAVVLGCPPESNHLWYHLFAPEQLEDTFMTGFLINHKRSGVWFYDCGVELSQTGRYGRNYRRIASLNLPSLYMLLWANFAAFCMALLTQPDAYDRIHGHIISPQLHLRHYCVSQLRKMWLHMSVNMNISAEECSFLVTSCMHKMLKAMVAQHPMSLQGKFEEVHELEMYERWWTDKIFAASWEPLVAEFDEYLQQLKQNTSEEILFKCLRALDVHYPRFPTESEMDLTMAMEQLPHDSSHFSVLSVFNRGYHQLHAGGDLLPDLIEFYWWIHYDLAYTLSEQEANEKSIKEVVVERSRSYFGEERSSHLLGLYERVKVGYNKYLEATGATVGIGQCARANKALEIKDESKFIRFLTVEKLPGVYDWIYSVIQDIINIQNHILDELTKHVSQSASNLRHYLPQMRAIHPLELSSSACILGKAEDDHGISEYVHLIRQRQHSKLQFDFESLQRDVVVTFLAGKPKIVDPHTIQIPFRFKMNMTYNHPIHDSLDIHLLEELPEAFKKPLDESCLAKVEYMFHSADYTKMENVASGLQKVAEKLLQRQKCKEVDIAKRHMPNLSVDEFVQQYMNYNNLKAVFKSNSCVKSINLSKAEVECLEHLKMSYIYGVTKHFAEWVESGFYDFSSLPWELKKQLSQKDLQSLTVQSLLEGYGGDLAVLHHLNVQLDALTKALVHWEIHLPTSIQEIKEKPMMEYLCETLLLIEKDDLPDQISDNVDILVENYVHFRIALRRLMNELHKRSSPLQTTELQWTEPDVTELWVPLAHLRKGTVW